MSQTNVQIVESLYRAMEQGDVAGIFERLDSSIRIEQTTELPWGGTYQGLDDARRFFTGVTGFLEAHVALERMVDSGEFVVAVGRTQGTVRANGHPFDVPLVHLWQLSDGRIKSLRVFLENSTMLAALDR